MPKSYGSCRTGGSIEQRPVPFPVDPTIQFTRPDPPPRQPRTHPTVKPRPHPNQPITPTERATILAAWAAGDPAKRIANRVGCSPSTVWQIVADARKAEGEAS